MLGMAVAITIRSCRGRERELGAAEFLPSDTYQRDEENRRIYADHDQPEPGRFWLETSFGIFVLVVFIRGPRRLGLGVCARHDWEEQ